MSKVRVYLKQQDPLRDRNPHTCSKSFAILITAAFPWLVRYARESLTLQLRTDEAWSSVKARMRPKTKTGTVAVPSLNAYGYHVMCLQAYPEPNRATTIHPHAAFLTADKLAADEPCAKDS